MIAEIGYLNRVFLQPWWFNTRQSFLQKLIIPIWPHRACGDAICSLVLLLSAMHLGWSPSLADPMERLCLMLCLTKTVSAFANFFEVDKAEGVTVRVAMGNGEALPDSFPEDVNLQPFLASQESQVWQEMRRLGPPERKKWTCLRQRRRDLYHVDKLYKVLLTIRSTYVRRAREHLFLQWDFCVRT